MKESELDRDEGRENACYKDKVINSDNDRHRDWD